MDQHLRTNTIMDQKSMQIDKQKQTIILITLIIFVLLYIFHSMTVTIVNRYKKTDTLLPLYFGEKDKKKQSTIRSRIQKEYDIEQGIYNKHIEK